MLLARLQALPFIFAGLLCVGSAPARAADPPLDPYAEPEVPVARPLAEVMAPRLLHDPVTEGRRGSAISITVALESDLKFDKIVLAYRRAGAAEFLGREMREAGSGSYATEIPVSATAGGEVAYFVEAQDKDGRAVATRGSLENPFVITLIPSEFPPPPRTDDAAGTGARAGDDDVSLQVDLSRLRLFVGLLVGSGLGWASGTGDLNADVPVGSAGFAAAKLGHVAPEVGVWLAPTLMLSLQGRLQAITGTTDVTAGARTYHAANFAAALFAKATWILGHRRLQPTFSLAGGVGRIRHVVTYARLTDCGASRRETCVDTVGAGPLLAGAGVGLLYPLRGRFILVAQANSQVGTPDFTVNLDFSVGVAAKF